uniref:Putative secreted protein n=1 Tax=Anopheles marajoara TaxID=58244 RepID=A0A2M4CCM5_9DIPT
MRASVRASAGRRGAARPCPVSATSAAAPARSSTPVCTASTSAARGRTSTSTTGRRSTTSRWSCATGCCTATSVRT